MKADDLTPKAGYLLKSELARVCLPSARKDTDRKLAWINSICILFLVIGLVGSQPAAVKMKPLPSMEEVIPAMVEPIVQPVASTTQEQSQDSTDQDQPDTPQVVIVTPETPNINFSIPTVGTLVVPSALAKAPPATALRPIAPVKQGPVSVASTGAGGERPQPPYPKIALQEHEQGTVTVLINVNDTGGVSSIEVKESSGFPILDRSTVDYIKRRWVVPPMNGTRTFETSITYKLK
ncbi:energy transducer TonB [Pedosphaera parvula]|uniref:TonB family protein n=1 Tax=Pedosphaera parvula (strain Ellin514) TaxID=320771 RepID=B9XKR2_PEDPL|nr:energy transducer TonB [Pedosphaera parvula]EEF59555.1 TonB family protein [Pedosphaera parvula Ellin514]